MGATTSPAAAVDDATTATRRFRQAARGRLQHWLPALLFTVLVGAQTVARTGDFTGAVDSTKPARNRFSQILVVDGYVCFWDGIPVHGDALSFLNLVRFLQGQHGPKDTGIYDLRAGYAYIGTLLSLLLGHYRSFVALNAFAWLAAALSMYWLGGAPAGQPAGCLDDGCADGDGTGFRVHGRHPAVSTLLGFASMVLVLAFVEWVGLLHPPFRWRDWLHTGWLIAAVSLFYPVYFALLAFLWLYGLAPGTVRSCTCWAFPAVTLGLAQDLAAPRRDGCGGWSSARPTAPCSRRRCTVGGRRSHAARVFS